MRTQPSEAQVACVDANTVVAWFDGELADGVRNEVHDHVDRCEDCRALFVEMGRALIDTPGSAVDVETFERAATAVTPAGTAVDAQAPVTIGRQIGRYVVLEWLGGGGMGVVFGAYDPELDRRVAIKVLRAGAHGEDERGAQERLLREAQSLARISHPGVIAVFDAGTHEGRVFLAMEHLRGGTLAGWLRSESHSSRTIVARFVEAGRGLAAAHERGVVHRDFKPSNVLLGVDGRARVTDFGLAAPSELAPSDIADEEGAAPRSAPESTIYGTPRYMSPEQRTRKKVDARSDQFSFCVALDEALRGERPHAAPRERTALPTRVRAAIDRGLSESPEARFSSMDALLAELTHERRARWQWTVLLAATCAIGVTLAGAHWGRAHAETKAQLCTGASQKLAGIWDAPRKEAVTAAFARTHAAYADDAAREVSRALDGYATKWSTMHTDACEATQIRGEQSAELMDLRMACLANQAREMKALTDLFAEADAKVVERSVQATYALPRAEECADVAALRSRVRVVKDPAVRRAIEEARDEMIRARALERAGRYADALHVARSRTDSAKATGDNALVSDLEYVIGRAQLRLGDIPAADATLYDAVEHAESAGDDLGKARALVQLTFNLGEREAKYDEATHAGRLATAVLTRWPDEIELRAKLEDNLAFIDDGRGRYTDALASAEHAIALREKAFGPDDYRVGMSLNNASKHVYLLGDIDKALAYQRRAATIVERSLGPHHPDLALALRNLAISELDLRRWDDALRDIQRALAIWRAAFGDEHPDIARGEGVLATILNTHGKPAEGLPHGERALALAEKYFGVDHPDHVNALVTVGKSYLALGRGAEAIAMNARAAAICERLGNPPNETAETLHDLGEALLHEGKTAQAIAALERALPLREKLGDKTELAETRLLLARALQSGGRGGARAIALAEQARDGFAAQRGYEVERASAEQWLHARSVR